MGIYNVRYMENEENNGLRSIERSKLRGAQGSKARPSAKKKTARSRASEQVPEENDELPPRRTERRRKEGGSGKIIGIALIAIVATSLLAMAEVIEPQTAVIVATIALGILFLFSMTTMFAAKRALIFGIAVIIAIFALITTTFATATLKLTLASAEVTIDGVFSAIREPAQSAEISYSKRGPYTETRKTTVTEITKERRNSRAVGTVTVYNTNNPEKGTPNLLKLVNRTRFKTKDGKIYRLVGPQNIPAGKKVDDKFVPGKKEVKVEADKVGDEYNLKEKGTRLTIPGLAGSKEFGDAYALTKTDIVGGFSGEQFIPDPKKAATAREQLRREIERKLRDTLAQALDTNTLSERVVFEDGIFINYESLENEQTADSVIIQEKGTLYAISFREVELAALLAKYAAPPAPSGVKPTSIDTAGLKMEMEKDEEFDIVSSTEFSFRLTGDATLFWNVDDHLFLSDIMGKERKEIEDIIMNQYPQVTQVNEFSLFPIWRTTTPGNKDKITVDIEYDGTQEEYPEEEISEIPEEDEQEQVKTETEPEEEEE